MNERIKVLYLPKWYPHRYDPMPGLFIERHARSVAKHVDVSALYIHPDDQMKNKNYEIVTSKDDELFQIKIYFKASKCSIGPMRQFINTVRFARSHLKGKKILKQENKLPDIIHVNVLTRHGVIALAHKMLTGTPYVITEHWTRYLPSTMLFTGWLRKVLTRKVVRNAAAVMPVTVNLQRAMESHGLTNPNYVIIPNVVDMFMFTPEYKTNATDKVKIVHVSCFEDKQKNISGLLRVLKKLADRRDDWEIQMIGDGIHHEMLTAYASEIGLDNKAVYFQGLKENEELVKFMKEAHFQVMFSRYENLPVVILESYACGVPVLSTDVGGIAEHMNKNLGLLLDSEDEEALFEKLNHMIDHRKDYKKDIIREYAEKHFSNNVIGQQLYDVYRNAVGKG